MARYWLGPWVWYTVPFPHWGPPVGATASLDLRSVAACSIRAIPQGFGLFVTPNNINLGSNYENLGTDPFSPWGASTRNRWKSALVLPQTIQANNLQAAIWETLTVQADPIGDDRCMPLVPTSRRRRYEVWLAGQLTQTKQFTLAGPESTPLIDMLKRQYRAIRSASLETGQYRKVLGSWVRKYEVSYRVFQPADVPDEQPRVPETAITETFDLTDGDPLGPNHTWVFDNHFGGNIWECKDNRAHKAFTNFDGQLAHADSPLSSDDQYCQLNTYGAGLGSEYYGPACRIPNSQARVGYSTLIDSSLQFLTKIIAGIQTNFHSVSQAWGNGVLLKVTADGSTIAGFKDSVEILSATDTAITGNLYAGIYAYSGDEGRADGFQAEDLGGGSNNATSNNILPKVTFTASGVATPPSFIATQTSNLPNIELTSSSGITPPQFVSTASMVLPSIEAVAIGVSAQSSFVSSIDVVLPNIGVVIVGEVIAAGYEAVLSALLPNVEFTSVMSHIGPDVFIEDLCISIIDVDTQINIIDVDTQVTVLSSC